mgnify:FL=1
MYISIGMCVLETKRYKYIVGIGGCAICVKGKCLGFLCGRNLGLALKPRFNVVEIQALNILGNQGSM